MPVAALSKSPASAASKQLELRDPFKNDSSGRNLSETVDDFLKRLPPTDPSSAVVGPWLWIVNPEPNHKGKDSDREDADRGASAEWGARCKALLDDYQAEEAKINKTMEGKALASITRKLTPQRKKLREDLLRASEEERCVCGKVCT